MRIFTLLFGDPFERELGRRLLEYFRKDEFSKDVLQDPDICYMYFLAQFHDTGHGKRASVDECWDALVEKCRKKGFVVPPRRD